ncbi:MAG: LytR C-terminal domain-containing protein [Patescibacteria group bacterium]
MTTRRPSSPRARSSVAAATESTPDVRPANRPPAFAFIVVVVVVLAAAALAVHNMFVPSSRSMAGQEAKTTGDAQLDNLVQRVSRHIFVNTTENPSIATVEDPDALRLQNAQFYANASKGDRLLVWSDKAVLYSPGQDKIMAVLMIEKPAVELTPQPTAEATTTSQLPESAPSVEVRNGSGVAGLGRTLSDDVKAAGMTTLTARNTTSKSVFPTTLVYVAPGKEFPTWLPKLQEVLGVSQIVSELPGELDLKGDIVVVVGADAKK